MVPWEVSDRWFLLGLEVVIEPVSNSVVAGLLMLEHVLVKASHQSTPIVLSKMWSAPVTLRKGMVIASINALP